MNTEEDIIVPLTAVKVNCPLGHEWNTEYWHTRSRFYVKREGRRPYRPDTIHLKQATCPTCGHRWSRMIPITSA